MKSYFNLYYFVIFLDHIILFEVNYTSAKELFLILSEMHFIPPWLANVIHSKMLIWMQRLS